MFDLLDFTQPEWFDYGRLLESYPEELLRLDRDGLLERAAHSIPREPETQPGAPTRRVR